jgi:phage-related protein
MERQEWVAVLFLEPAGRRPVAEFLANLDLKTQSRLRRAVEQLIERNVHASEPLVRHLEDKLWELRVESNTNIYRLIYFFAPGRRIVLLHGFQKKTQKAPRREIELAARRMAEFLHREGIDPR